jgi:hypothetical protein
MVVGALLYMGAVLARVLPWWVISDGTLALVMVGLLIWIAKSR